MYTIKKGHDIICPKCKTKLDMLPQHKENLKLIPEGQEDDHLILVDDEIRMHYMLEHNSWPSNKGLIND